MRRSAGGTASLTSAGAGTLASLLGLGVALWRRRHDGHSQLLLALFLACAAALAAFGHVLEDYLTGDPLVQWDVSFAVWIHEHSNPALVDFFKVVTQVGGVVVLALVTVVAAGLLYRAGARHEALLVLWVALGIEVLNAGLKLIFHRPRPELSFLHLDTYSMPSGHAAGATAIYLFLAYLLVRRRSNAARVLVGFAAVVLIVAVGFSRIYLGAHYLSDVLAGTSLGVAWAAAWLLAYESGATRRAVARIARRQDVVPTGETPRR